MNEFMCGATGRFAQPSSFVPDDDADLFSLERTIIRAVHIRRHHPAIVFVPFRKAFFERTSVQMNMADCSHGGLHGLWRIRVGAVRTHPDLLMSEPIGRSQYGAQVTGVLHLFEVEFQCCI